MPDRPRSVNPATGETLAEHAWLSDDALDAALDRAAAHRPAPVAERTAALARLADALDAATGDLARTMTAEMGKPLAQAEAEINKSAAACRFYAAHAEALLADEPRALAAAPDARAAVVTAPHGPLLAIMPWNFPVWQAVRVLAPALAVGNPVLLKHAPNVLGTAGALVRLVQDAVGEAAMQHVPVETGRVAGLIPDARVAAVTLTGSEGAGRAVGAAAGAALKPCVLELGGSDAFVVLADADLDAAARAAVWGRTQNTGQSCIAAKRFLIEASVAEAFTERFAAGLAALTVGDPMDPATDLGPLARSDLRETVHDQTRRAAAGGARLVTGGTLPDGPGFFYPPTLLDGVPESGLPFREEVFGPVAFVTEARDADDALRLANATRFGLGGSVWTSDVERGAALARRLRAGVVAVNAVPASFSELPFGGVGASGFGRELGVEGLRAFALVQSVVVQP